MILFLKFYIYQLYVLEYLILNTIFLFDLNVNLKYYDNDISIYNKII